MNRHSSQRNARIVIKIQAEPADAVPRRVWRDAAAKSEPARCTNRVTKRMLASRSQIPDARDDPSAVNAGYAHGIEDTG